MEDSKPSQTSSAAAPLTSPPTPATPPAATTASATSPHKVSPKAFMVRRKRPSEGGSGSALARGPIEVSILQYADDGSVVNKAFECGEKCFMLMLQQKDNKAANSVTFQLEAALKQFVESQAGLPDAPQAVSDLAPTSVVGPRCLLT